MMNKLTIPAKEEQDLHIAIHIEPEALPAIIQPVMALAQSDAEKDMQLLGQNFHSVVLRMAVQIERMAMVLSALRIQTPSGRPFTDRIQTGLHCSDADYQTAELIGNKLMLHMAAAYKMIKGVEEEAVPQVQVLDQRQVLLSLLPTEFETKVLLDEAKAQGVPIRTANRWNEKWVAEGIVIKIKQGHYRKRLASA